MGKSAMHNHDNNATWCSLGTQSFSEASWNSKIAWFVVNLHTKSTFSKLRWTKAIYLRLKRNKFLNPYFIYVVFVDVLGWRYAQATWWFAFWTLLSRRLDVAIKASTTKNELYQLTFLREYQLSAMDAWDLHLVGALHVQIEAIL
jgi:hypothetical protein